MGSLHQLLDLRKTSAHLPVCALSALLPFPHLALHAKSCQRTLCGVCCGWKERKTPNEEGLKGLKSNGRPEMEGQDVGEEYKQCVRLWLQGKNRGGKAEMVKSNWRNRERSVIFELCLKKCIYYSISMGL